MSGEVVYLSEYRAKRRPVEPWLTTRKQAAAHLQRSVSWVKLREKDADLPRRVCKGSNFYRASELDAWLESYLQGRLCNP